MASTLVSPYFLPKHPRGDTRPDGGLENIGVVNKFDFLPCRIMHRRSSRLQPSTLRAGSYPRTVGFAVELRIEDEVPLPITCGWLVLTICGPALVHLRFVAHPGRSDLRCPGTRFAHLPEVVLTCLLPRMMAMNDPEGTGPVVM